MEKALINLLTASLGIAQAQADADFYRREADDMRAFRAHLGKPEVGHREFSLFTPRDGRA